jgi:C-terminal processing protease CtpA/Prc
MNLLSNSDALIIDLRKNGGGSPAMVAYLSSYLFGSEPVHLNSLYWRKTGKTQEWWTDPEVPGPHMPEVPVYVLISGYTFSAAEEFTYNLQSLKRATIIGETSGGGANPGGPRPITPHVTLNVPSGRAINPITGTNWEGVGVIPEIKCPADDALDVARRKALTTLREHSDNEAHKALLDKALSALDSAGN